MASLTNLKDLFCTHNALTVLDLTMCTELVSVICSYNQIGFLNLNNATHLWRVDADHNNLTTLFINNGTAQSPASSNLLANPDLAEVCLDNLDGSVAAYIAYHYPNCLITSNCSLSDTSLVPEINFATAPNPLKDILNIQFKDGIAISSVSIYNTLGQLVLVITEPASAIDVSGLKTGHYFIKVISDKGSANSKFIKE